MSPVTPDLLGELHQAAVAAQQEEIAFRNGVAEGIARRERARQFAFRRLELARVMLSAARQCQSEDEAVKRQIAALKDELGWHSDNGVRPRVYAAWEPVAKAIWRSLPDEKRHRESETASVREALEAFEYWYQSEVGQPFLSLFDQEIPEMPVIEF